MSFLSRLRQAIRLKITPTHLILVGLFLVVVLAFWLGPWPGGDDWETFYYASHRLIENPSSLYGERITHAYYSNPPWLAASLLPLSLFSFKWSWAVISALTVTLAFLLLRRWAKRPGILKILLVILSPGMIYTIMHGQIDVLIISGLLLPDALWPVAAITKPQVAIGLLFGVKRENWLRAALLTLGILLASFLAFGFWPQQLLAQPAPFVMATHNLWYGIWPFQVPAGVMLIVLGISRRDERLLVAGSPLVSPYAATSSLLGPWIAAVTFLKDWQALLVFASWWGAVIYRGMGY
jgi:hypothetical protein